MYAQGSTVFRNWRHDFDSSRPGGLDEIRYLRLAGSLEFPGSGKTKKPESNSGFLN